MQFAAHALSEPVCQFRALVERKARHGHEGAYVRGAHAGVGTVVGAHVDDL